MKKNLKASIFSIEITNNLFYKTFEEIFNEFYSKIKNGDKDDYVIDVGRNNNQTSIWFDSFDHKETFNNNIFDNTICFLMAHDSNSPFEEIQENKELKNRNTDEKIRQKTPTHCIYLKNENRLIVEESENGARTLPLQKGLKSISAVEFKPIKRDDIVDRLRKFIDNIKSVSLLDLKLEKYLKNPEQMTDEEKSESFSIISHNETKIKAYIDVSKNEGLKKDIFIFFEKMFSNTKHRVDLSNIKIKYTNEYEKEEIADLFDNLINIKINLENYYDDLSNFDTESRSEYSKSVYMAFIETYNEEIRK